MKLVRTFFGKDREPETIFEDDQFPVPIRVELENGHYWEIYEEKNGVLQLRAYADSESGAALEFRIAPRSSNVIDVRSVRLGERK